MPTGMKMFRLCYSLYLTVLGWTLVASMSSASDQNQMIPTALDDYVQRQDPAFAFKVVEKQTRKAGQYLQIELTSQRWHDIVWKHALCVYEPAELTQRRHMLLFITGGSNGRPPRADDHNLGFNLARLTQARVAVLHQVPNQPLMGGRHEDDLISETWLQYLKSGDPTWPLLFPMVKSAVRAMDALTAVAQSEWKQPLDGFVVTGASKRGWTSWLTAAADRRIVATAPIVIDVLNFQPQMQHQLDTWGKYSDQIHDYTSKDLVHPKKETARESMLRHMMDPYTYRSRLTVPKLAINGTNDPYWVVDALNLYWDDLQGAKFIKYVPNAGHGLKGGTDQAMRSLAAFFRHVVSDRPMPKLQWQFETTSDPMRLTVRSDRPVAKMQLWSAFSEDKDFRDARWTSRDLSAEKDTYAATVERPATGHVAFYAEAHYQDTPAPYSLSTQIHRE